MCLVYAINIAARYVVSTVFEPIRLDLHLTDSGAAFLTGPPLALFYVTCGIPIAWLADRSNRRNIVAASLVLWSTFTVFCGLASSYLQFLLSRIGAGVGEAGATPPSTSIISDCFPAERRLMALSVFALGAPIGAWLAADVAGAVAQAYGWRASLPGTRRSRRGARRAGVRHHPRAAARTARQRGQRRAGLVFRVARVPVAPAGGLPRHHGERGLLAVGLGPGVVRRRPFCCAATG